MSLTVSETETYVREVAPEGTFVARCVQVIDLGLQHSKKFNKDRKRVLIGWELPTELREFDGQETPWIVWNEYTASLNEKATLRKHLESWRGGKFTPTELKSFNLESVITKCCLLNIVHSTDAEGRVWANVSSVMALPAKTEVPEQVNSSIVFDISTWDQGTFESLGDNLRERISRGAEALKELEESTPESKPESEEVIEDNIPF